MAKKDDAPDAGEVLLDGLTEGKTGLESISDEQLQFLGGDRDPIDSEDFSDADFGNDLPDGFDDRSPELAAASAAADKDKDDDDDKGEGKDDEADDTGDAGDPGADSKDGDGDDSKDGDDDSKDTGDDDKDADADDDADPDKDKDEPGEHVDADDDAKDDDKDDDADADADAKAKGKRDGDSEELEPKSREQQIPKSRFDKVNQRRRVAEEELKQLKAEKKAGDEAEAFDFDAAEKEYLDLALSGKTDKALEKRKEIRVAEQAAYAAHANTTAVDASKEGRDQVELDALVSKYETQYPDLNPESETYSEDLMDEVTSMYVGYQSLGFERPEAFKMACDNVVKLYELVEGANKGEPTTPKKDLKKPTGKVKKPIKKTKEKLDAAKKQPADPNKAGTGASDDARPPIRIEDMSDEDLAALPSATLAKLRGDIL